MVVSFLICSAWAKDQGAESPLTAWTYFQKPQPVQRTEQPPRAPTQPELSSQTLSGTIVKEGGIYVLQVSDGAVYQLDDQERARAFESRKVKVEGTLQAGSNLIHVVNIESIS